ALSRRPRRGDHRRNLRAVARRRRDADSSHQGRAGGPVRKWRRAMTQPRNPNQIWKEQSMQAQTFTPEMLSRRARGLDDHIRRRNLFEYCAAGLVVAVCLVISALLIGSGIDT